MWKTSGNVFLGLLGEWVFDIFPTLHSIKGLPSQYLLKFSWSCGNIQFKPYATSKMELFVTENGNSWELVLTVVTEHSVLNVTGLLDPIPKHIDKLRLRQ